MAFPTDSPASESMLTAPRLGTLLGMEMKSRFNLEGQKEQFKMVGLRQGAQIGNFYKGGPDKYFWKGQGAQIGTFVRMDLTKCFLLDEQENGRFGAGRPDWELW